jgi:pullulanase
MEEINWFRGHDKRSEWNMGCKSRRRLKGKFYVFKVQINGKWLNEVPDPYAKAVGVNGKRAMVVDLKETNPINWEKDKSPYLKIKPMRFFTNCTCRDASIAEIQE